MQAVAGNPPLSWQSLLAASAARRVCGRSDAVAVGEPGADDARGDVLHEARGAGGQVNGVACAPAAPAAGGASAARRAAAAAASPAGERDGARQGERDGARQGGEQKTGQFFHDARPRVDRLSSGGSEKTVPRCPEKPGPPLKRRVVSSPTFVPSRPSRRPYCKAPRRGRSQRYSLHPSLGGPLMSRCTRPRETSGRTVIPLVRSRLRSSGPRGDRQRRQHWCRRRRFRDRRLGHRDEPPVEL